MMIRVESIIHWQNVPYWPYLAYGYPTRCLINGYVHQVRQKIEWIGIIEEEVIRYAMTTFGRLKTFAHYYWYCHSATALESSASATMAKV